LAPNSPAETIRKLAEPAANGRWEQSEEFSDGFVKLLHLADLHLDRPFVGLALEDARARRRELREALQRCLALAAEHRVDAITIGGDLWEDEHVTPDTARWVSHVLGSVEVPVVLVAGNHDPLRPGGPHRRVQWPANVCVLGADSPPAHPGLQRWDLGPLSIWGMSWGTVPLTAEALRAFAAPPDGRLHALLIHGTAGGGAFEDSAHCPFTAADVRRAGFQLCLAGHLHAGGVREGIVVYPGSPEPLAWDESGRHTAAIVELSHRAPPHVELIDVNRRRYAQAVVDCDGARSSAEVEQALRRAIAHAAADGRDPDRAPDPGGRALGGRAPNAGAPGPAREGLCLRAVLRGRVDPECRIDLADLAAARGELALLELRDETQPAFDLDALAAQPTALGMFVCDLRERIARSDADEAQRRRLELALDLGLRAMHGEDLARAA
jgi:exonuclease SbcD